MRPIKYGILIASGPTADYTLCHGWKLWKESEA